MTTNTIELEFADGAYIFALPLQRIDELQRKTGIGIGGLFARVLKGCILAPKDGDKVREVVLVPNAAEFYALDLIETIRQGLIGGGKGIVGGQEIEVTPIIANKLVDNYVMQRPLRESWSMAASILGACIIGFDPPKKGEPAKARASAKRKTKA